MNRIVGSLSDTGNLKGDSARGADAHTPVPHILKIRSAPQSVWKTILIPKFPGSHMCAIVSTGSKLVSVPVRGNVGRCDVWFRYDSCSACENPLPVYEGLTCPMPVESGGGDPRHVLSCCLRSIQDGYLGSCRGRCPSYGREGKINVTPRTGSMVLQ